ncbi:MAG: DUF1345 domain-containing protein [Thiohalocapsa sp.]
MDWRRAELPPLPRLHAARVLRAHVRFIGSLALGLAVGLLLPSSLTATQRTVIGWDCGIVVFLVAVIVMAARATPDAMVRRAALQGEAGWVFVTLLASAAFFSLFAILGLMRHAKSQGGEAMVMLTVLAGVTILLSWLFTHTVFAVHYAHEYLKDRAHHRRIGLDFPAERDDPDYWDFLYFSFVVGMTAQVSDVRVMTRRWRRLVLAHGILSFLFNTAILALSINLLAGFF